MSFPFKRVILASELLGAMSTGYLKLVDAFGPYQVIKPKGEVFFAFLAGKVAYDGNPNINIGYPDNLGFYIGENILDLTKTVNRAMVLGGWLATDDLVNVANQPLTMSLSSNIAT